MDHGVGLSRVIIGEDGLRIKTAHCTSYVADVRTYARTYTHI